MLAKKWNIAPISLSKISIDNSSRWTFTSMHQYQMIGGCTIIQIGKRKPVMHQNRELSLIGHSFWNERLFGGVLKSKLFAQNCGGTVVWLFDSTFFLLLFLVPIRGIHISTIKQKALFVRPSNIFLQSMVQACSYSLHRSKRFSCKLVIICFPFIIDHCVCGGKSTCSPYMWPHMGAHVTCTGMRICEFSYICKYIWVEMRPHRCLWTWKYLL